MSTKERTQKETGEAPEERGIVPINIVTEMKDSYLDYAMSVITSRALPDARDGLKPVHRRILYTMFELGLVPNGKFRKSAKVVGDVIGNYHPHGDSAVYDAMVKMAQDFSFRYPLVLGQGNFGSVDGDAAAAYRYTEAKMSKVSQEMLRDIDKDTVDFRPNYDNRLKEPVVLPTAVPALLLNGTLGIAVGMATNIPPHNLGEIMDASAHLIENPDATVEDLLQFVKGPDFPTGGLAFNKQDIQHAYVHGRGGVLCRGEAEITENKAGNFQIIITSIPFRVNKSELIKKIAELVHEKKLEGIRDIRDESTRDIRVVIDLKNGALPQTVLNYLYKHTDLETTFNYNMVALVDNVPQLTSLKGLLQPFLSHRYQVVTRRTKFDLGKAEDRAHILEGLKKALDHIDEIIKLIKKSKTVVEAHTNLMKEFKFSDKQATAILEMRLQKLAGLERKAIEDELKEKRELIAYLKDLLAHPKKLWALIKGELTAIKEQYGDERRTRIYASGAKAFSEEDLVAEKDAVLVLTRGGYVKRTDPVEYKKQKRGGVGVIDLNTKEEDVVTNLITASTHSDLLFFSDRGKAYQIKMWSVPEGRRATKGKSVMNFIALEQQDNVTSVLAMPKEAKAMKGLSLFMVTKQGVTKKVSADSFKDVRRNGLIAIKLAPGDELLSAMFAEKGDEIVCVSREGQSIRFEESDVREMGRNAGGVRGMKLDKGDVLVSAGIIKKGTKAELLVVSEHGYGKRTDLDEYKVQNRGGSGIKTMKVTDKTGMLVGAKVVTEEDSELVAMSKKGQVIRTDLSSVASLGRDTQGVRVMKLYEGDSVASFVCW